MPCSSVMAGREAPALAPSFTMRWMRRGRSVKKSTSMAGPIFFARTEISHPKHLDYKRLRMARLFFAG